MWVKWEKREMVKGGYVCVSLITISFSCWASFDFFLELLDGVNQITLQKIMYDLPQFSVLGIVFPIYPPCMNGLAHNR